MSEPNKVEAALLPVDILRQAGINFVCRYRREDIKQVIFNDPATVVFWSDGTKTVVKCSGNDTFDPEIGLAMAICKKAFGNTGTYNDVFKKWVYGSPSKKDCVVSTFDMRLKLVDYCNKIDTCIGCKLGSPTYRCGSGVHFTSQDIDGNFTMTDEEIVDAYKRVFGK